MKSRYLFLITLTFLLAACINLKCFAITVAEPDSDNYISDIEPEGIYRWSKGKMPIKIFFQSDETVCGYKPLLARELASCLDEWVKASNGKFSWAQSSQPDDADVIVRWTENTIQRLKGIEVGQTKTYTSFNRLTNHGIIKKAEVLLSTRFPNHEPSEFEIRRTYLHEAGHIFGIAGHSHNRDDVMFLTVSAGETRPCLSERDKETIRQLYDVSAVESAISAVAS